MKKVVILLLIVFIFSSCKNKKEKPQYLYEDIQYYESLQSQIDRRVDFLQIIHDKKIYFSQVEIDLAKNRILATPEMKIYLNPDSDSEFYHFNDDTYMYAFSEKIIDNERWILFITEDKLFGWLSGNDLPFDNSYYYTEAVLNCKNPDELHSSYSRAKYKELQFLKTHSGFRRNGPDLYISNGSSETVLSDSIISMGSFYNLSDDFTKGYILINLHFYEGGKTVIFDMDTFSEVGTLLEAPVYSPDNKYFISVGRIYGECFLYYLHEVKDGIISLIAEGDMFNSTACDYMCFIDEIKWISNTEFFVIFKSDDPLYSCKVKGVMGDKLQLAVRELKPLVE